MQARKKIFSKLPGKRYIHRDISWLSFNDRVFQEAENQANPLFERIKFMAIYSNNLDEFFRVRVANHRNLIRVGKKTKARLDYDPMEIMKQIRQRVNARQERYSALFQQQLLPELERHGIDLLDHLHLSPEQEEFVDQYFNKHMLPFVQPVLLMKQKVRPFLNNAALYLIAVLQDLEKPPGHANYAIIKVPSDHLPRFLALPTQGGRHAVIILDDIVRRSIPWLFPGYQIKGIYSIKLTRDAELYIDDEFSGDLIEKIRKSLTKRNIGPASRLVYDRSMDVATLQFLKEMFELETIDLFPEGRYHNNMDFFSFPDFGKKELTLAPLPPLPFTLLEDAPDLWARLRVRNHLINPPYHRYESVIRFFEDAASDPAVTRIKLVQYRVGGTSRIMAALIQAARQGKEVTVFIEVKARFDEEANLRWGEELQAHGVNVHYSFPGLKVHAKLAMIERMESDLPQRYAYLSTGNFHEGTVRVYSDLGLFTADPRLCDEVARIFTFLETVRLPDTPFEHLLVGQFNLNAVFRELIDYEIEAALRGEPAEIRLKLNSLQDPEYIDHLYRASQAGVKIKLIIRGICCLIPGIAGMSDNIEIISIVDRFLEHGRILIFHHGGEERIYLSSADWMSRNLHYRIETAFPLYHPEIRQIALDLFELQWRDNLKARIIDQQGLNHLRRPEEDVPFRSQHQTYLYFQERLSRSGKKT